MENDRLPQTEAARATLAAETGADGKLLPAALDAAAAERPELAQLPKVESLHRVWAAQHVTEKGRLRLGEAAELPPSAEQVCSPYDPDARHSAKRDVTWTGYKAQLTETCDPACEGPHVITNVETTVATTPDWDRKVVTCRRARRASPGCHTLGAGAAAWSTKPASHGGTARLALRPRCTRAKREPRIVSLQAREHFEALQAARTHQDTEAFRANYAARAGIKGTQAQAVRRCGLRRCRYVGLAKTRLQHVLTAAAVNLVRIAEWLAGSPAANTRVPRFAALQAAA